MIVVDTNIIAYFYIPGQFSQLTESLMKKDPSWHVPYLWRTEMRNVLAGYLRRGHLTIEKVSKIMIEAESFLEQREYLIDSKRIIDLISTSACTAYDCEFVALAQKLDVSLITTDQKIIKQFPSVARNLADFVA